MTAEPLRVQLLGPVRAWRGETELDLGSARRRAVFAVLAMRANQVVSREEIVDAVWGESPPSSVEGSLYTYVSGLRRALEPDRSRWSTGQVLVSAGSGYSLRLGPDESDASGFGQLRTRAQEWAARGDTPGALAALDAALGLWHGDALSGISGPFAELHRARLAELRLTTLERRAETVLESGGHAEVVAELSGLASEYPSREAPRGLLMLALYRSGRPGEALEVFRETRATLIDELGIEPSPALRILHDQILADDPALGVPVAPPVSPAHPHRPELFVGRDEEVHALRTYVEKLAAGQGAVVWLEGEPGIGKSSLLAAGLAGAVSAGCVVHWGAADEAGTGGPLALVLDCLEAGPESEFARTLREDTPPAYAWQVSDPVLAATDRLLAYVDALCADTPLVLVMEDLHWADDASLLVWQRLVRTARRWPLLLIGTCRPVPRRVELGQLRTTAAGASGELIRLRPLTGPDVAELVERLAGGKPGSTLLGLADRAAGNPLYVTETVTTLVMDGLVDVEDGVAEVLEDAEISATLAPAITRRLGFLSEETKEMLRWAALLGVEFDLGDVAVVMRKQASELVSAVEEAMAAGILGEAGQRFVFTHAVVRNALYDERPAALLIGLHRQAAEMLDEAGAPAERVAEQLAAAPIAVDAWITRWLLSTTTTIAAGSPSIVVELLQRAMASSGVRGELRMTFGARLTRLLFWLGGYPETEARAVVAMTTDVDLAAEMRLILAFIDYNRGESERAIEALKETAVDPAVPQLWQVRHRVLRAMLERLLHDDQAEAEADALSALAAATADGDVLAIAQSLQDLWRFESVNRRHERALVHIDRALEVVRDNLDLVDFQLALLDNKVFTQHNLDRLEDAGRTLIEADDLATRRGLPGGLRLPAATHWFWLGRWDDALVQLDAVVRDGPEITLYGLRQRWGILLLHGVSALIAAHRDDSAGLETHLKAAEKYARSTMEQKEYCDFLLAASAIAAEQGGRLDEALEELAPVLDLRYAQMMLRHQWLPTIVRLAIDAGRPEVARKALDVCETEAAAEAEPARATAAAAWCRGLIDGDPELVLPVVARYRELGRKFEAAMAAEDVAVLLAASGRLDEARRSFLEAVAVYAEVGAMWDVGRAESRLRPFGIRRTSRVPASGGERLSPLEMRIAELVAAGWPNPDIATQLTLPRSAVQVHVTRILQKLAVGSRLGVTPTTLTHYSS
ncbi:BTAD domain-containing putative transcriptional regulator [Amycolatopsis sp.]|jgi:DNA-binding SARP family transcriptional activator/tetratricopeptide (TPR) repeat protein/DNA-binding CsgD family transcriptional regulator|uniref:BTAD domain-containing putative transcriptional regulator n=1 Tax=Amycolatopsis sp. TaxID=37632 RepID=UPI002E04C27A|nr:BTAD domain-containing putative transcriptional regulator [Amycolatopsis sp.]